MKYGIYLTILLSLLILSCNTNKDTKIQELRERSDSTGVELNKVQNYVPSKPIDFPHAKHMELEGMDCVTCHADERKGKQEMSKSKVCLECHDPK
jgi:hypothetical protein